MSGTGVPQGKVRVVGWAPTGHAARNLTAPAASLDCCYVGGVLFVQFVGNRDPNEKYPNDPNTTCALLALRGVQLVGNSARQVSDTSSVGVGSGGAVFAAVSELGTLELSGCYMEGNEADNRGGAVDLELTGSVANVTVAGTVIRGSWAGQEGAGLALKARNGVGMVQITNLTVGPGVAVAPALSAPTGSVRTIIADNAAGAYGGAGGGGIYMELGTGSVGLLNISAAAFVNNSAPCLACSGGALHVDASGGGAVWAAHVTDGARLVNNSAGVDGKLGGAEESQWIRSYVNVWS